MKRRQFLKMIGGTVAASALPLSIAKSQPATGIANVATMDFEVDPKQVQALESRRYTVDECARIFNIPPHMLNSIASLKSKDIEDQHLEFITTTIQPWFRKWEQAPEAQAATERALINNK